LVKVLISQKNIDKFFSFINFPKLLFFFNLLIFTTSNDIARSENNNVTDNNKNLIKLEYLENTSSLEDYIIDTGDHLSITFYPANELSCIFPVNSEGEIYLPRLFKTYVRGLTTIELKGLLKEKYSQFLVEPDIQVNIAKFKSIRVSINGEINLPGTYTFPGYTSRASYNFLESKTKEYGTAADFSNELLMREQASSACLSKYFQTNNETPERLTFGSERQKITTISDAIRKAGGITNKTNLSSIEIIRNVPIGKGGGKKRAFVDFSPFINNSDLTSDIRLFDGDRLYFSKLNNASNNQISKSILSGLAPRFIEVNIFGRVESPGILKLPVGSVLSDVIDIAGPLNRLSGKIILMRYSQDGSLLKEKISYSSGAKRGSSRNPFIQQGDIVAVRNSFFGKTTGLIKEITEPFAGIYSTKKLIEDF
tara:strand:+ start:13092 stop:14363 length:1272 start_codon:yes stop_codon:yes gene_type:complete